MEGCIRTRAPRRRLHLFYRAIELNPDAIGSKWDMGRVASSSSSIQAIRYKNPREADLPVEVVSLAKLRSKAPPGFLESPRRPKFHEVHVVTDGHLEIEVDFEHVPLDHRAVAWVRPGQV